MYRIKCVICYGKLEILFQRTNFPITANPPKSSQEYNNDIYSDQVFYKCVNCSCTQLGTLIDPVILYDSCHNNTFNTPTWKEHHSKFCDFIDIKKYKHILEIGGTGILYNLLKAKQPDIQYTSLDICDPVEPISDITYYKGNCEDYNFPENIPVVLSHVFEHLFNPRKFVESLSNSNVESIYISIPNMAKLLDTNTSNILHNEHTFYIDKVIIEWLFSQYNYQLSDYYEFRNHSIFLHFVKKHTYLEQSIELIRRPEISEKIYKLFKEDGNRLKNIKIKDNSFIIPAGLYGQFIIYSCNPSNIRGFLDNDRTKQNQRVYGTPYTVFSFDEILKYDNLTIYILAGPYKNELIQQINSYNKNIEIIEL